MTKIFAAAAHSQTGLVGIAQRLVAVLDSIPLWFIALGARIFPAAVFWQSGATKVAGWHLKPGAIALFQDEYRLPLVDPTAAAYAAAFAENFFPDLAGHRACDAICGPCAVVYDGRDRNLRLSGRMAHPWRVGHLLSFGDCQGPWHTLARPLDRAPCLQTRFMEAQMKVFGDGKKC